MENPFSNAISCRRNRNLIFHGKGNRKTFSWFLFNNKRNWNEKTFSPSFTPNIFFSLSSCMKGLNSIPQRGKKQQRKRTNQQQLTMDNSGGLTSGTVLLRSVSIFLSNRRQSKQLKEQQQKAEKKKRTKTLSKLDEQMGKLQPKMLESLKRKTHFNKWVNK